MNRFFSRSHQPKILGLLNPTTKMLRFFPVCQLVGKSEERINFTSNDALLMPVLPALKNVCDRIVHVLTTIRHEQFCHKCFLKVPVSLFKHVVVFMFP